MRAILRSTHGHTAPMPRGPRCAPSPWHKWQCPEARPMWSLRKDSSVISIPGIRAPGPGALNVMVLDTTAAGGKTPLPIMSVYVNFVSHKQRTYPRSIREFFKPQDVVVCTGRTALYSGFISPEYHRRGWRFWDAKHAFKRYFAQWPVCVFSRSVARSSGAGNACSGSGTMAAANASFSAASAISGLAKMEVQSSTSTGPPSGLEI